MKKIASAAFAATLALAAAVIPSKASASGSWHEVWSDAFNEHAPVGSFGDCNHNALTPKTAYCAKLPTALRNELWAYPYGWPDTATDRNYPEGGIYDPEHTLSIANGDLHVHMFNSKGVNHVAAVIPKAVAGQTYGRYEIRFYASTTPGYKLAWLLWPDDEKACVDCEIDFPELELDQKISGFVHHKGDVNDAHQSGFDTGQPYGVWHTATTEWRPGNVTFYLDGKKVGSSSNAIPDKAMTWVIQSESALNGERAASGSHADIYIAWATAWRWQS